MFNNLIESSSHKREFKRRGSFFLFTTAGYALLFMIVGVVSIYAYDANLREQTTEVTMLTFVPPAPDSEINFHPQRVRPENSASNNSNSVRPTRPLLIDSPDNPNNVPDRIGVTAPVVPPAPPGTIIGPEIQNPPGSGRIGNGSGEDSDRIAPGHVIEVGTPPPPAPSPSPKKIITSPTILNSKALDLPKPPYPVIAKQAHVQGTVSVQVLIDETGKVITANAVSGHPLLSFEAVRAAYRARFSPTLLGNQPVKVSGVITYNFVLQ